MTTAPNDPTDQTTYTQQQLPNADGSAVDWDKFQYVVKTPEEIDASLFGPEYAAALSAALLRAYGIEATPQQLTVCDAMAQRTTAMNLLRDLQQAHG